MEKDHDVRLDYAGFGGHPRYTCYTCGATCLRQPWMSDLQWRQKLEEWRKDHPFGLLKNEGYRG